MRDARRGLPYIFGKNGVVYGVSRRFTLILLPRTAPDDVNKLCRILREQPGESAG